MCKGLAFRHAACVGWVARAHADFGHDYALRLALILGCQPAFSFWCLNMTVSDAVCIAGVAAAGSLPTWSTYSSLSVFVGPGNEGLCGEVGGPLQALS